MDTLKAIGIKLTNWTERWVPDALIIALILTIIAYVMSLIWGQVGAFQSITNWGTGFFSPAILSFAMHMVWIMWTGYVIAVSPPVARILDWLSTRPNPEKPWQAVALLAVFSMVTAWLNWGLSLIGSAMFIVYLARRQPQVDYRLMVITGYTGLGLIWHSGLSGSATLLVATPGHFAEKIPKEMPMGLIETTRTILSPWNLIMAVLVLVVFTVFVALLHPRPEQTVKASPERLEKLARWVPPAKPAEMPLLATRINWSPLWTVLVAIAGYSWVIWWLVTKGTITLEVVNLTFMTTGMLLHWYPQRFLAAVADAVKATWGIILQFPFYGGILGIIQYSKLAEVFASWFVAISTPQTYPLFAYWYAGILNYFVPSGGSEWIITAPYLLEAARQLGVSYATITVAYAWGDMMTDVIQPFWAIPLMTITAVEFREIMGYALAIFIPYMIMVSVALLFIPLIM